MKCFFRLVAADDPKAAHPVQCGRKASRVWIVSLEGWYHFDAFLPGGARSYYLTLLKTNGCRI
eukprot:2040571-Amphidinium_carterae.1